MRIGVVADFVPFLLKAYNELGVVFDLFAHNKKRGMNTPLPQDLHQAFRVAARAVVKRQRAKIAPLAHFQDGAAVHHRPRAISGSVPGNNETPAHSSADAQTRINRARIMTRPLKNGKHGLSKKLYARCGASSSTEALPPQGFIIQASKEKHSP